MLMIHLSGVNFDNHGAVMMLETVLEQLSTRMEGVSFCTRAGRDYEARKQFPLYQRFQVQRGGRDLSFIGSFIPHDLRKRFGIVVDSDIGGWLDLSGFAFGDYWGAAKVRQRLYPMLDHKRRRGTPVILLPQALGPFETPGMRTTFRRVVDEADLIFVRDGASHSHLIDCYGERRNFRRCPDFTLDLPGRHNSTHARLAGRAIVVPNHMVVRNAGADAEERYLQLLEVAVATLRLAGENPYVLLHDPEQDEALGSALAGRCGELEIVVERDAAVAKAVIGGASMIVSSRFHALVSGLSQGIPSIGIGWSHKYAELLADYDCPECLISLTDGGEAQLKSILGRWTDRSVRDGHSALLRGRAAKQTATVAAMWDEVVRTLGEKCALAISSG